VSDAFEHIHRDWQWIERNVFVQLSEMDLPKIDDFLMTTFEDIVRRKAPEVETNTIELQLLRDRFLVSFPLPSEPLLNCKHPSKPLKTKQTC